MKKIIWYLCIIVIFSVILSLNRFKIFSLDEASIFLTVIGLIYWLIAAFSISNAREKFSKIRDAVTEETTSFELIYAYTKQLTDKISFENIRDKIVAYCKEVPEVDWKHYRTSDTTHKKFRELTALIAGITTTTPKDKAVRAEISEEIRDAASARNAQLILSQTRISPIQWILNIFLSVILVIWLTMLSIPNYTLSIFFVSTMITAIVMILLVIYELDSLRFSDREVSIEPYTAVVNLITNDKKITKGQK
jgi:hypothetical protein